VSPDESEVVKSLNRVSNGEELWVVKVEEEVKTPSDLRSAVSLARAVCAPEVSPLASSFSSAMRSLARVSRAEVEVLLLAEVLAELAVLLVAAVLAVDVLELEPVKSA
jgi:hypothetical protein